MRLTADEILRISAILAVGEGCKTKAEIVSWVKTRCNALQKAGAIPYTTEQVTRKVEELTQKGELRMDEGLIVL